MKMVLITMVTKSLTVMTKTVRMLKLYADVEDCRDGVDNDNDGLVDCADSDCAGEASADANGNAGFCEVVEQSCDDDFDNDGDGDADCADHQF